jgi:hypothetical protein
MDISPLTTKNRWRSEGGSYAHHEKITVDKGAERRLFTNAFSS